MDKIEQTAQPQNAAIEPLLTPAEASFILKMKPRTLENWRGRRSDGPPYIRLSHQIVRYDRQALMNWLAARTATSTAAEALKPSPEPLAAA